MTRHRYVVITVDLDDTLWPCAPVIRQAEEEHYRWLQGAAARLTAIHDLDSLRRHRHWLLQQRPDIAHDFTALRTASLQLLLEQAGEPPALAETATAVFLQARNRVTPYPEVTTVLQTLRATHQLVSVSNGNADVQQTPLRDHFHLSLNARSVGAAKPDPQMFLQALAHTGSEPPQAVHLGDDPELDVEAARRLGMTAVWMNRAGGVWPDHLEPPAVTVNDLSQFQHWLTTV